MNESSTDRIVAGLRAWIAQSAPGTRLPSSRALAAEYGASPVTVQRAMHTLTGLGLIDTKPGVGTFVRRPPVTHPADYSWQTGALGPAIPAPQALPESQRDVVPGSIELHSGYPCPALLPGPIVQAASVRAARTHHALTRAPAAGVPELQAWFAAEVSAGSAAPHAARDAIIVPGTQNALGSVFRALVGQGGALVIESPSYWGALLAAAQLGITLVPIATTPAGPDPAELDRALRDSGARAFYAQPTFANPLGGSWSPERGRAILATLREHGAFLIEDDWARDFAIDHAPAPLARDDAEGRVVYVRSLTKSLSPAIRIGAVVARGPARDRILADRAADSMYVSPLLQATALDVVTSSGWRSHLRALPEQLRGRRDLLLASLAKHTPSAHVAALPQGGLNVWLRLPDGVDARATARACASSGVALAAGDAWFPTEPSGPYLRLNFAGPEPERFPEAAAILEGVLQDQLRG
ncbi:GntR family transcriptional regulator [Leucobacter luti]|uniref:GntR family transcriptional regulator n=1 Tax=Leucobacter luti TaxID=340320 RepID=A0A4R6RZG1_9MICO|nr:PLP-dependent aminotransferase family protein [Leucobacter luti]TDP92589.1 GntR family transcriptional regulator [Leucobacter luti]